MGVAAKEYPIQYFLASAVSATINYPLWRASAVSQSGFAVQTIKGVPTLFAPFIHAFSPPYKGALATVGGMTWARAGIFYGSDAGRDWLRKNNYSETVATVVPPLTTSIIVQVVNQPIVRATITIQNPASEIPNVFAACSYIYQNYGIQGLWHGTSAGILKTVPKYCTAVIVKDLVEDMLPEPELDSPTYDRDQLVRSAYKSSAAGIAGAVLTNPLDCIRNEMFKTNLGLTATIKLLREQTGWQFLWRGLDKNMVAVAIPVACTIFLTDAFIQYTQHYEQHKTHDTAAVVPTTMTTTTTTTTASTNNRKNDVVATTPK